MEYKTANKKLIFLLLSLSIGLSKAVIFLLSLPSSHNISFQITTISIRVLKIHNCSSYYFIIFTDGFHWLVTREAIPNSKAT